MGSAGRYVLLLIVGTLYAVFKLGDELIRFTEDSYRFVDDLGIFIGGVDDLVEQFIEIWSLETLILLLVVIFLVYAISDYVSSNA